MIIRLLDIFLSFVGVIFFAPILLIVSLLIFIESGGPVIYVQNRVGKDNKDFKLLKFRSMFLNSEVRGFITIGNCDPRITRVGRIIRKYKIDELPQLFNVIKGEMSIVGPRPEVRKYVNLYDKIQFKILNVKPGITDYASIEFREENRILEKEINPENYYINVIMPYKLKLNLQYINNQNIRNYLKIIVLTFISFFRR